MTLLPLFSWLSYATLRGSVAIALIALLMLLFGARVAARWRHALWLIVLVRLAIPVAPASNWSIFNLLPMVERAAPLTMLEVERRAAGPHLTTVPEVLTLRALPPPALVQVLVAIWLFGAALFTLRIAIATLRVHRSIRRAFRANGERRDLLPIVDAARERLGIRRTVRVLECDAVRTPALHGLIRPLLLLPRGFAASFDRRETRHVVLHELWHLRRLDVALNWVLSAAQVLHWFNPFVWFAISRINEERELACDELALSCLEEDERFDYARTILKLLETLRIAAPAPALVGIVNDKQKMKRRLMMIASFRNRTRFSILFFAAAALIATVGFTDPTRVERRIMKRINHGASEGLEKLDQRISFSLNNGTLSDLLSTVANKTGVVLKQAPEAATSPVQQARFTIQAVNVPAHVALNEALAPFQLAPVPDGSGFAIAAAPRMELEADGDDAEAEAEDDHAPGTVQKEERRIVVKGEGDGGLRRMEAGGGMPASGKLHKEMTINLSENGNETRGSMKIDIVAPPASK